MRYQRSKTRLGEFDNTHKHHLQGQDNYIPSKADADHNTYAHVCLSLCTGDETWITNSNTDLLLNKRSKLGRK